MSIKISELSKVYGETRAVDRVTLDLPDETQVLALIGPSGGGKSTFLRLIGGLEAPTSGEICLDGISLPRSEIALQEVRRKNGFLFQSFNLFPHLSARENIVLPLVEVHGRDRAEAIERTEVVADRFGLVEHLGKMPGELSGGQQQRIALARAMAHEPEFLLLDEPTSALDPEMKSEVLDVVQELCDAGQKIVLTTHEMGFAKRSADHVVFLSEGRNIEEGSSKEIFTSPRTDQVRSFLEKVMKW